MYQKYAWDAKDYEVNSSVQQKWATEIIVKLELKGDERILDIGCGDGKNTAQIAQCVPDGYVLGIDSSEQMIHLARDRHPITHHPNLKFQYGDALNLKFIGEFDLVVSFACLHWVQDHIPVLEGIRNSLKNGGKTFLQFGGKGNAARIFDSAEKVMARRRWRGYFDGFLFPYAFYEPYEYVKKIETIGLRTKRVELIPKEVIHENKESFQGWIRTTWLPYLERIPQDLQEEFLIDIVDNYIKNYPPDEKGLIHVQMMRLEVETIRR